MGPQMDVRGITIDRYYDDMLQVIHTEPQVVGVGLSESQALALYRNGFQGRRGSSSELAHLLQKGRNKELVSMEANRFVPHAH